MTRKTPLEIQEQAAEAQTLLDTPVFKEAHFTLRKQYLGELLAQPVGSLTAQHAHAKLLALEDVVQQLKSFITEEKMHQRKR